MSVEDRLRQVWGSQFSEKMDIAVDAYNGLDSSTKDRFDRNDHRNFEALVLMNSPQYRDPKLPGHARASEMVSDFFQRVHGDDLPFQGG